MVLKSKLPSRQASKAGVPPWAVVSTRKDYAKGRTGGVAWNWMECLEAQAAVATMRNKTEAEAQARYEAEQRAHVFFYVGRMGFLEFTVQFFQDLYFGWRYGILPEDR